MAENTIQHLEGEVEAFNLIKEPDTLDIVFEGAYPFILADAGEAFLPEMAKGDMPMSWPSAIAR